MSKYFHPLMGRERELEQLINELAQIMEGRGRIVFVTGEAGIGKTYLIEEFVKLARGSGCAIFKSICLQDVLTPYYPFREMVEEVKNADIQNQYGLNLLEIFNGQMQSDRSLFDFLELITDISSITPCIIVIEDMQWADSRSVQMVHFLSRNIRNKRLLILGSYRTEDVVSGEGREAILLDALRILPREGFFREMYLGPLSEVEMGEALNIIMDNQLERTLFRRIVEESEGNPMYAIETIRYLVSGSHISMRDGIWSMNKETHLEIPQSLKDLIVPRVQRLNIRERQAIELASLLEGSIEPELLAKSTRLELIPILETLDNISRTTHLIEPRGDSYFFVHEKIRRTIKEEIPDARKLSLHRSITDILLAANDAESAAERLSFHCWESRSYCECIDWSNHAGEKCLKSDAPAEALIYFKRAMKSLEIIGGVAKDVFNRTELGLARSLRMLGRMREAADHFEKALDYSPEGKVRAVSLWNLADCYGPMYLGKGDHSISNKLLNEAEALVDVEPLDMGEIASSRATIAIQTASLESAEPYFDAAESMFEKTGDTERLIRQICSRALAYVLNGDIARAMATMGKAERNLSVIGISTEVEISYRYCFIFLASGDYESAANWLDKCGELSDKLGDNVTSWSIHLYRSIMHDMLGDHIAAEKEAEAGRGLAENIGSPYNLAASNAILIHALSIMGKRAKAEMASIELEEAAVSLTMSPKSLTWGLIFAARGEIAFQQGNEPSFRDMFTKSIEIHDNSQFRHLHGALTRVWFGDHLVTLGHAKEATEKYREALELFRHIGNLQQMSKLETMINGFVDNKVAHIHED